MAKESNKMEPIWISNDEFDIKDEVIEIGEKSFHKFPDKARRSPLGSPVFSRAQLADAILISAPNDEAYQIINGTVIFKNGPPYEILDDSWTFDTAEMEAILSRSSCARLVDKKDNGSGSGKVAEKKSNDGGSCSTTARMSCDNEKAEVKPKIKPRPKLSISRYTRNCAIGFCCQIMAVSLIFCLIYAPLHYKFVAWPQPPAECASNIMGIDMNEKQELEQDVEMALTVDKTAAQDRFEWELENSPGIPIEHLDHREYQIGNQHVIDHARFPNFV